MNSESWIVNIQLVARVKAVSKIKALFDHHRIAMHCIVLRAPQHRITVGWRLRCIQAETAPENLIDFLNLLLSCLTNASMFFSLFFFVLSSQFVSLQCYNCVIFLLLLVSFEFYFFTGIVLKLRLSVVVRAFF